MKKGQFLFRQFLLINQGLIEKDPSYLKALSTYFEASEIQLEFRKGSNETIERLVRLISNYKNHNRTFFIKFPRELTTSYKQFLDFFTEYIKTAKGIEIQFDTFKRHESIEIHINTNKNISMSKVGEYLNEYLGFTKQNLERLKIPIETTLTKNEFNLLILDLKHQVTSLKHSLDLAYLKNDILSENVDYFKQLTSDFANKENIIHNQIIQGGEQQFADKIKNNEN